MREAWIVGQLYQQKTCPKCPVYGLNKKTDLRKTLLQAVF